MTNEHHQQAEARARAWLKQRGFTQEFDIQDLTALLLSTHAAALEEVLPDVEEMMRHACFIRNETCIIGAQLKEIELRIEKVVVLEKKIRQQAQERTP